jgi:sterol desaturase/sphingolipid hydroxylase (fatty acid hydroxylase superfamily)
MSNARTFIWVFVYVQAAFIAVDLYEHWRLGRQPDAKKVIRRNTAVILAVVGACAGYSVIQLALASALPDIGKVADWALRVTSTPRPTAAPSLALAIPVFVAAFVIGTFFDYLVHRFLLHGPLWRLHENHHLPSVVSNVMPGIAARPFVIVPNFLINAGSCAAIFLAVRIVGNPRLITAFIYVVPALLLTFTFVACASHSIFLRRFDLVETSFRALLLIGPREHLVHHSAVVEGNYGNFTSLWDRALGTYVSPTECDDQRLGLAYDQDFLGAITAGRFKLPRSIRSRFQVGLVCRIADSGIDVARQTKVARQRSN